MARSQSLSLLLISVGMFGSRPADAGTAASQRSPEASLEAPEDGGTPGDPTRNTVGAKRGGDGHARALLAMLQESRTGSPAAVPEAAAIETPRWQFHEFTASGRSHVENPFRDAALIGEFTSPSGKMTTVEGFFDGDDTWRLRFAPGEEGDWTYLLRGKGFEFQSRGKLRCTAATSRGFVGIHPTNPFAFAYSDGTPFFPMGDTCYGLFDDSPITPALRAEYLATRRSQRF